MPDSSKPHPAKLARTVTKSAQHYQLVVCGILLCYILALVVGAVYQYTHPYNPDLAEPLDDCET